MKKELKIVFCLSLVLVLSLSLVSAGSLDNLFKEFTGKLVSEAFNSKIENNNSEAVSGNLKMILQKKVNGEWINVDLAVEQQIYIPAFESVDLNTLWNTIGVSAKSSGDYRIYVELELNNGEIISSFKEFEIKGGINSNENKKAISLYSGKEVFLISDKNWKDVLPLVPVTTWTQQEEIIVNVKEVTERQKMFVFIRR